MGPAVFAAYFDQWEGEEGHRLWLRNVRGFDEQDTADFEPVGMRTPTRIVWGEQDRWMPVDVPRRSSLVRPTPTASSFLAPDTSPEDRPAEVAKALTAFL